MQQGSLTRAGEVLNVAQSAITVAIRKLEEELGVALLVRGHNRRISATIEGEILLRATDRIFCELDQMARELADAQTLRVGEIRVGVPPMYGYSSFMPMVVEFRRLYSGIKLVILEGSAGEIGGMLDREEIDLAIIESRGARDKWECRLVGSEELVLAVGQGHSLATKTAIKSRDLSNVDFVAFDKSFLQRKIIDDICKTRGVKYKNVMESNYAPFAIHAALCGMGAVTLLRSLVDTTEGLVAVSFSPPEVFHFNLCWLSEHHLSGATKAFIDYMLGKVTQ